MSKSKKKSKTNANSELSASANNQMDNNDLQQAKESNKKSRKNMK